MAAIANAIDNAIGRRLTELPMSPPKIVAALDERRRRSACCDRVDVPRRPRGSVERLQPALHRRRARVRGRGEDLRGRDQGDGPAVYPGLGEHLEEETTVAIDGAIHDQVGYFQAIRQGCEVFFIPKLEGG